MTRKLSNEDKLDNYEEAVYMGDQLLRTILLHENANLEVDNKYSSYLEGEAKGIQNLMYKLTKDSKYSWTPRQLQDHYLENEKEEDNNE